MARRKYSTFPTAASEDAAAPHPITRAWWGTRLFFSWVSPLMALGQRKQLDADDVWALQPRHQSGIVSAKFMWDFDATRSIPRSFVRSFGWRFAFAGLGFLVALLSSLVGPVVLNHVLSSLMSASFSIENVSVWVGVLFASQVLQALVDNYANFELELITIEFIGCLRSLLYFKTMRLSAQARMEKSTGDITNLYAADCDTLAEGAYHVHQTWVVPLQIGIVSYMLFDLLNVAAFAGIGVIVITLALNQCVSQRMISAQRVYRASKDVRMKKVTETFKGVANVKYNAWEDKVMKQIADTRAEELSNLFKYYLESAKSTLLTWAMPALISGISFTLYSVVLGRELTPAVVFTSLALFQMIQGPLRYITVVVSIVIQSKVALESISSFMELSELEAKPSLTGVGPVPDARSKKTVVVSIENATFGWDAQNMVLHNINLQIKAGNFYVVHGTVGCGKSSFCSALLGEMVKHSGSVYVGGSIAYCSQQPWIQNMTVRDNILFGLPFDRKKYEKILDACALTKDLQTLAAGDMTEIGERGVNVSGGQKARIALARACYSDASIYVLDSPLSAVDAIVQNEIFQKCLLSVLREKTVILVTHNPDIIASEHVTHAVTIDENGNMFETRKTQTRLTFQPLLSPLATRGDTNAVGTVVAFEEHTETEADSTHDNMNHTESAAEETGKLIDEEYRAQGRVDSTVLTAYFNAIGGAWVVMAIVLCQAMWQVLQVASDLWLGLWASDSTKNDERPTTGYRVSVYMALGVVAAFTVVARTLTISVFGLRASKSLFNRMTQSLLHAPMRFFDTNPIGRVLTRYSSDVSIVDSMLPPSFATFFSLFFTVCGSIFTAAVIIRWNALLLLPILYVYSRVGSFYVEPAREIQRLRMTSEAPMLSHLSESLDGSNVLRAFGQLHVDRFIRANHEKIDYASKIWYVQACVVTWFSLRIQLVGSAVSLVVAASLVVLHDRLSPAVLGLAFSYALKISQSLEQLVHVFSRLETLLASAERVQEYADILQESASRQTVFDPPNDLNWPLTGSIEFNKVSFCYKEGDKLVLRDVTFSIEGGQKVGIVGRTGAGKSSLTVALFRINELAGGTISIDGVDISKIGLKTLREKLSIIPQNPVLFKGTVRAYLDPFDDFSDDELWIAINRVGLIERIGSDDRKLDCAVEENGENFSVGERQMLCMARALLRHSRIVIFDEATAAIDYETDQKLQRVIREAFAESTVLTIAHRLDTILDSDRILVLENGELVEFASPAALVKKGSGHFYELMQEGGYLDKLAAK